MKTILISGSIAYDSVLVFEGYFKDHILPEKAHMLNVAFLTPGLRREFGGTAANIGYNLSLLGQKPTLLGSVGGQDGQAYLDRMSRWGIDLSQVKVVANAFTAQAFITTDLSDNQITAFHPGAMNFSHEVTAPAGDLGLISPNGKLAMHTHAEQMRSNRTPYWFDPGQGLPMFNGAELKTFIAGAQAVVVNDYEAQMLADKTGLSLEAIAQQVEALVVTRGGEGCDLYTKGRKQSVLAASISKAVDPTGCGDAFRAGLVHARLQGADWLAAAQLGSVMGAVKIEHPGAQNHRPTKQNIAERFEAAYGAMGFNL